MTQVEIAKKILEQGNCTGFDCTTDCCPFYDMANSEPNTNCLVWLKNKHSNWCRDINKVKQWLKEKEMIDLTVNQIVDPPVKCWVKGDTNSEWIEEKLHSIDHRFDHPYKCLDYAFKTCTLTDPTKKFKPWLKVEDIPVELWSRNLYKHKDEPVSSGDILCPYKISDDEGNLLDDLVYLPIGQPLTGEWLEMGEWV